MTIRYDTIEEFNVDYLSCVEQKPNSAAKYVVLSTASTSHPLLIFATELIKKHLRYMIHDCI